MSTPEAARKITGPRSRVRSFVQRWRRGETRRRIRINDLCPGFSGRKHWNFFKSVLADPSIQEICVLGVYFGRDIAYMTALLALEGRPRYRITGVDTFSGEPGQDWPEHLKDKSWDEAWGFPAPTLEGALTRLAPLDPGGRVELRQATADEYLGSPGRGFDFIYIDIAHDYASTRAAIEASLPRLNPGGVIAGDDYSNEGQWGVKDAVTQCLPSHEVYAGWIWHARIGASRG